MAERRGLPWNTVIILLGFAVISFGYAVVSPPFENPDEMSHAEYAAFIGAVRRLPTVDRDCVRLAFHPPLYHVLLAPVARVMGLGPEEIMSGHRRNPDFATTGVMLVHGYPDETFPFADVSRFVFLGRLLSIACGLVVLVYTYRLAGLLSDDAIVHGVAVSVVAAIPQFEYLAASLNHDMMAAAFATMTLFYAVRLAEQDSLVTASKCGLCLGLGLLTKSSFVPLLVVPALAAIGAPIGVMRRLRIVAVVYVAAGCIAGWWYVRNVLLYGHVLPTIPLHETTWIGTGLVNHGTVDVAYFRAMADQLFRSFWFLAGLMNVSAPSWMYWGWGIVSTIGVAGMVVLSRRGLGGLVLVGAWVGVLAGIVQYNVHIYSAQGRYLFIVTSVFGVAVAFAVASAGPRWRRMVGAGVVAGMASLAVGCFVGSFRPTYAIAESAQRAADRETARLYCRNEYAQPIRVSGGRLHGFTVDARRLGAGDFELDMALKRSDGQVLQRASLPGSELTEQASEKTLWFEPIDTQPGEVLLVSFRAPAAIPLSRPLLAYSLHAPSELSLVAKGSLEHGHIWMREEYE